uniref:Uncharacterized protein n=1 Tax=Arcella intermedia TaxID=1963864 RepID=A0A6B2L0A9_9EUKA
MREIYEKAVSVAIPHSVDLWCHYCTFVSDRSDDVEEVRRLFERGLEIVGTDYVAHPLWDKYLGFEMAKSNWKRAYAIFLRILHIPLEHISSYWERFKVFLNSKPLQDMITDQEAAQMDAEKVDSLEKRKAWVLADKEKVYFKTLAQTNLRRLFETEVLKVNYFHVRSLGEEQLNNWLRYLEFEEAQGDYQRVVKLYERCLIPCCNYIKFWLKYVRYVERYGKEKAKAENTLSSYTAPEARIVFDKACSVYLKKRIEIHMEAAAFEEQYGFYDRARAYYQKVQKISPGHVESVLRHISLERRQGNFKQCEKLFEQALSKYTSKETPTPSAPSSHPYEETHAVFLYIQYANLCGRVYDSPQRAREVFTDAVAKYGKHKEIWLAYLAFEKNRGGPEVEERVSSVYNEAVHKYKGLAEHDRQVLLMDWIEYCSDEGSNLQRFRDLSQEYYECFTAYDATLASSGHKRSVEVDTSLEPPAKHGSSYDYNSYNYYQGYDYNNTYHNYPYHPPYDPRATGMEHN